MSDRARLATKAHPASFLAVSAGCRRPRSRLTVTVAMSTTLPKVPTTAATPSTPTYSAATAGLRLHSDRPRSASASAAELFIPRSPTSGNSMVSQQRPRPFSFSFQFQRRLTDPRYSNRCKIYEMESENIFIIASSSFYRHYHRCCGSFWVQF